MADARRGRRAARRGYGGCGASGCGQRARGGCGRERVRGGADRRASGLPRTSGAFALPNRLLPSVARPSSRPTAPSRPSFRPQAIPGFRSVYASKPFAPPVARPQAVPHSPVVLRSLVVHVPKPPTLPGPSRPALPGHSRPVRLPACAFVRFLPAFHYDARRRAGKREPGFAAQISESRKGKQDRWHKAKRARTRGERGKGAAGDGHGKRLHPNRHAGKQRKPAPAAPFPSTPRRHASCKTRAGGSAFAGGAAVFG